MKDKQTQTSSGGIGFVGLLTIVFVVAKIWGYLNWSWWWVFSPLWISGGVVIGILLLALVFYIIIEILK